MTDAIILAGGPDWLLVEAVADALGEPMPPDWWKAEVVQARQDHLSAVASFTVTAFTAALPFRETPNWDAALRTFSFEMVALDDAMRDYTGLTGRGDVVEVVRQAMTGAASAPLAEMVVQMLVTVRGG